MILSPTTIVTVTIVAASLVGGVIVITATLVITIGCVTVKLRDGHRKGQSHTFSTAAIQPQSQGNLAVSGVCYNGVLLLAVTASSCK